MKTHCITCNAKFDKPSRSKKYCKSCVQKRRKLSTQKQTEERRKERELQNKINKKKNKSYIDPKYLHRNYKEEINGKT
jgi:hypothetical protein